MKTETTLDVAGAFNYIAADKYLISRNLHNFAAPISRLNALYSTASLSTCKPAEDALSNLFTLYCVLSALMKLTKRSGWLLIERRSNFLICVLFIRLISALEPTDDVLLTALRVYLAN